MIAFDDEQTTLDIITRALREGNFPVDGKPLYLKAFPANNQLR